MNTLGIPGLVSVLVISGGLAGCCGSIQCDCDATSAGDVVLQFDQDSLQNGFRAANVRGAYVVRYARTGFLAALDTARLRLTGSGASSGYSYLVRLKFLSWPVRAGGQPTAGLADYNYRFLLPNASRTYEVSNLEVVTGVTSGCCACPINIRRRFGLNGSPVVAEGNAAVTILRR